VSDYQCERRARFHSASAEGFWQFRPEAEAILGATPSRSRFVALALQEPELAAILALGRALAVQMPTQW
jgi:hypothetical protein